jgi:anti-sigma regulatory factor (Ser/Thr protein kinase)
LTREDTFVTAASARGEALATRTPGAEWELRTFLELGALPTAVPCARLHARQVVWEWQLSHLAAAVELVVSEITTNAVRASASLTASRFAGKWAPGTPPVRLWLYSDRERILIRVWDGNDQMPARQDADPSAEGGRGLLLVESLAADWGASRLANSSGKVVWALIRAEASS